jgi:hypothetical protein
MSEPTTAEPTIAPDMSTPAAPRTLDELVAAAAKDAGIDLDKPAPEPEKPADEPAEATEDKAEAEPEERPKDEDAQPPKGSLAWRWAQTRKREKELEQRSGELAELKRKGDELMAAIKARDEQTRTVAQLVELAKQDPDRAFAMLAERAGMSDHQLYERITRQRLRDPSQREEAPELAELRAEIRAMREEQRQRLEAEQTKATQQTQAQAMEADVAKVVALADYPDRWPMASEWPTERLQAEARRLVSKAYRENEPMTAKDLADRLERMASYEEETRTKVRQARSKSPVPAETASGRDGRGLPGAETAPKPAGTRRAALSNTDNASSAARKAPTTFDERFALAVEEALAAQE